MITINIPKKLPLLLISDQVLLPGSSMRVTVTKPKSMEMIKRRVLSRDTVSSTIIGLIPREKGRDVEDVEVDTIGCAALVVQVTGTNWPHPAFTLLVKGLCRFKLNALFMEIPYPVGIVTQLDKLSEDEGESSEELLAASKSFKEAITKLIDLIKLPDWLAAKIKSIPMQDLPDAFAVICNATYKEKLDILNAIDLSERYKKVLSIAERQLKVLDNMNSGSLKHILISTKNSDPRIMPGQSIMKMKNMIDDGSDADEIRELQKKLEAAKLPPHAHKVAMKNFERLKKLSSFSPEHGILWSYVDLLAELPWCISSTETLDINKAKMDMDADHYAMDKLKNRVLEYLAVRKLKNSLRGPILCFVGPPGVGKTSLGRSIAQTMGREFHRISVGGISNQSDIRGHRRTYIGSMPGRIIQGIKACGVNNPVLLLDEVDKMGVGIHGDPAAALLEVLDPEQNCNFVDHYVNIPFDLSQVMFICTANTIKTISPALLDRMEIIHMQGYTQEEKLFIAKNHLFPKQLKEHGLNKDMLQLPDDTIKLLVAGYSREAGVRTLERNLAALCRAVAVKVAEIKFGENKSSDETKIADKTDSAALINVTTPPELPIILDETALEDILGPPLFSNSEIWARLGQPGVAVGLATSQLIGGQVLLVEAGKMEGNGKLILTGQLGNVMKESAQLALNWVRTVSDVYSLKIDREMKSTIDIHIHFPEGAVGKDGPSAGVTIATALVSLFLQRPISTDIAMTGEITLTGVVLPVGGIKDKVLAAHENGFTRIILPHKCEKDLHEIPQNIKECIKFVFVNHMHNVLQAAFDGGVSKTGTPLSGILSKL